MDQGDNLGRLASISAPLRPLIKLKNPSLSDALDEFHQVTARTAVCLGSLAIVVR